MLYKKRKNGRLFPNFFIPLQRQKRMMEFSIANFFLPESGFASNGKF